MRQFIAMLKPYKEDIIFVDKTGVVISVYLKGDVKVSKSFKNTDIASRNFTKARRILEDKKVG